MRLSRDTHYRRGVGIAQLEQRVRLLPSVRSCSVDAQRITVLVDDATDRRNVAAGVAYILADLDMERMVHVLGGTTPTLELLPATPRRSAGLVLAAVLAVVCVAVGVVLLVSDNRGRSDPSDEPRPAPPQVTTTVASSAPATSTPTFPPDWKLRPGT
jgi:hypothetical protein